jgi:branched-chain amino acid transport system ATP-binding protein
MLSDVRSYCSFTEKAYDLLSQVGLGGREHILACNLPHADQRKLEIAVALATEPHLLLLDEPTAGVAVEEVPEVMNVITGLKKAHRELTIIVIEHKLDVVMSMSESIIVMSEGRVIADDKPDRIARNELVQKAYLGETSEHFRG